MTLTSAQNGLEDDSFIAEQTMPVNIAQEVNQPSDS